MRVAILYDFMDVIGGGERVAFVLGRDLRAPIFTTRLEPSLPARAGFPDADVRSLGPVPANPPLRQIAATIRFTRARLREFDRIVCIGSYSLYAAANHGQHMWYCLTPTRAFFDRREAMLRRLPPARRALAALWSSAHGRWEQRSVRRVRRIYTLSRTVQERIRRFYGRDAAVIYPPVSLERFRFREVGDFWLSVNRLYPEKRVELQIEIFRRLPRERLVVVGGAPADAARGPYVRSLRPPTNVEFLRDVPEDRLADLYARCRGLLATAVDEDFGLTPVEAMAAGKCVLATDEGGYRESVVHGETGFLLRPNPEAFLERILALDDGTLRAMRPACERRAQAFAEPVFVKKVREELRWSD